MIARVFQAMSQRPGYVAETHEGEVRGLAAAAVEAMLGGLGALGALGPDAAASPAFGVAATASTPAGVAGSAAGTLAMPPPAARTTGRAPSREASPARIVGGNRGGQPTLSPRLQAAQAANALADRALSLLDGAAGAAAPSAALKRAREAQQEARREHAAAVAAATGAVAEAAQIAELDRQTKALRAETQQLLSGATAGAAATAPAGNPGSVGLLADMGSAGLQVGDLGALVAAARGDVPSAGGHPSFVSRGATAGQLQLQQLAKAVISGPGSAAVGQGARDHGAARGADRWGPAAALEPRRSSTLADPLRQLGEEENFYEMLSGNPAVSALLGVEDRRKLSADPQHFYKRMEAGRREADQQAEEHLKAAAQLNPGDPAREAHLMQTMAAVQQARAYTQAQADVGVMQSQLGLPFKAAVQAIANPALRQHTLDLARAQPELRAALMGGSAAGRSTASSGLGLDIGGAGAAPRPPPPRVVIEEVRQPAQPQQAVQPRPGIRPNLTCHHCRNPGHGWRACPALQAVLAQDPGEHARLSAQYEATGAGGAPLPPPPPRR